MFEIRITTLHTSFAPDDDRWLDQVRLLHEELRAEAGPSCLLTSAKGSPGTKGALADVVLLLTAPSVVAGAVRAFTSWLGRDRARSVRLTWNADGRQGQLTVTGESLDPATLRAAVEHGLQAATQLGPAEGNRPEPVELSGGPEPCGPETPGEPRDA